MGIHRFNNEDMGIRRFHFLACDFTDFVLIAPILGGNALWRGTTYASAKIIWPVYSSFYNLYSAMT